jgi:hypothetical protein
MHPKRFGGPPAADFALWLSDQSVLWSKPRLTMRFTQTNPWAKALTQPQPSAWSI